MPRREAQIETKYTLEAQTQESPPALKRPKTIRNKVRKTKDLNKVVFQGLPTFPGFVLNQLVELRVRRSPIVECSKACKVVRLLWGLAPVSQTTSLQRSTPQFLLSLLSSADIISGGFSHIEVFDSAL
eukprot:3792208-Amphidinium_carterae.1